MRTRMTSPPTVTLSERVDGLRGVVSFVAVLPPTANEVGAPQIWVTFGRRGGHVWKSLDERDLNAEELTPEDSDDCKEARRRERLKE